MPRNKRWSYPLDNYLSFISLFPSSLSAVVQILGTGLYVGLQIVDVTTIYIPKVRNLTLQSLLRDYSTN